MTTATLIPLAELARRLNIPQRRVDRLIDAGLLNPDYTANRYHLFRPERINSIQEEIKKFEEVSQ